MSDISMAAPVFTLCLGYTSPVGELLPRLPRVIAEIIVEYALPCFGGRLVAELSQVAMARGAMGGIVYDKGAELRYWRPQGDTVVFTSDETHPDFRADPLSWTVISVDGKDWVLRAIHGIGLFAEDLETGHRQFIGQDCEELYHADGDGDEYITYGGRYANRSALWSLRATLAGSTTPLDAPCIGGAGTRKRKMPCAHTRSAVMCDGEMCTRNFDGLVSVGDAAGVCRLSARTMACVSKRWDRYRPICFGDNYLAIADGEMIRIYR